MRTLVFSLGLLLAFFAAPELVMAQSNICIPGPNCKPSDCAKLTSTCIPTPNCKPSDCLKALLNPTSAQGNGVAVATSNSNATNAAKKSTCSTAPVKCNKKAMASQAVSQAKADDCNPICPPACCKGLSKEVKSNRKVGQASQKTTL